MSQQIAAFMRAYLAGLKVNRAIGGIQQKMTLIQIGMMNHDLMPRCQQHTATLGGSFQLPGQFQQPIDFIADSGLLFRQPTMFLSQALLLRFVSVDLCQQFRHSVQQSLPFPGECNRPFPQRTRNIS